MAREKARHKTRAPDARGGDIFLEKTVYRQRRWRDAARAVPALGVVLVLVPILWQKGPAANAAQSSSSAIYIFLVWALMIAAAAVLAPRLKREPHDPDDEDRR